ncbi:DUF1178 family protein [Alteraurantiacibacter aquimixticola]|uniref:DUF1178 family protein n=1 Tax=Alteraurantiacibacter aquimixticola TaxID=2489173 RepID=A0A4T3F1I1_9SPHN|nr:DUF1178 family protein [Alteraurantiacibacter aquimixticola]TIX50135.1 DUF1178 family protein [Alteraurantiacibacter aquimixticola]
MIVFDLSCDAGHHFEGWFGSSADFASQQERGLLTCPQCGSAEVIKAPMAPAVPKKGNQLADIVARGREDAGKSGPEEGLPAASDVQPVSNAPMPPEVQQALEKLAEAQAKALKRSKWVGNKFADDARAMHYGERDAEPIHGETSVEEAERLLEEGIEIAPLPFPVSPPEELN